MFAPSSTVLAGSKRGHSDNTLSHTSGSSLFFHNEHQAEHIDPSALHCNTCQGQPNYHIMADVRPAKRMASASKVAEYHNVLGGDTHSSKNTDSQPSSNGGIDDCFLQFCNQDCDFSTTCTGSCHPCSGNAECPKDEACYDPECDQDPCFTGCDDPECTKASCPSIPCCCQKCCAEACSLVNTNECHMAHSASVGSGTVCYGDVPCHIQDSSHFSHQTSFAHGMRAGLPCSDLVDAASALCSVATQPSIAAAAAVLSLSQNPYMGNYSNQSTPTTGSQGDRGYYANISFDNCHVDQSCCHLSLPTCQQCPPGPHDSFNSWNPNMMQSNASSNLQSFPSADFGVQQQHSYVGSLPSANSALYNTIPSNTHGFHAPSWMSGNTRSYESLPPTFDYSTLDDTPQLKHSHSIPNAASARTSLLKNEPSDTDSGINTRPASKQPTPNISDSGDAKPNICKWQIQDNVPCDLTFPTAEALHNHIKASHVDNCTSCVCLWENCEASGKDFKQRSKLSRHLLLHARYRPYACSFPDCTKTFATNQAKHNHERTHTGEKPYVCRTCGYTTTTHTQLQTHISALHTHSKPHKCRFCPFTCADSSNLSKHERTHQTLRPYKCPHPGCTFKPDCRWENLKRHFKRSGHCPELLEDGELGKAFRERVRKEVEEWTRRNEVGSGRGTSVESAIVRGQSREG
ncbi:hypothetical protein GQ43DRAFT_402057 [Delitschia confertaspora ATCC 74209]|uniref:C2H2-type domain-containing protein n=1 Tax=Delitschia confertaspora ATCC 74209 TaxID=1513339 RepID=A0A9P4JGL5_9PLEO|nr:hypothetical protein GQ43DRAFT_402057 [Delitschia confertaspora ATCC 74209]